MKVHIQRAVPPPASFAQAQNQLEAALKQHPNAIDKVALQNALADLQFAWGKSWNLYAQYVALADWKQNEVQIAESHFWRAYSSDTILRPEKAFEDQTQIAAVSYNSAKPKKAKAAIWMLRQVIAHYRKTQNIPALAHALSLLGIFQSDNNLDEGMRYANEALSLYSKVPGHLDEKGDSWYSIGYIYSSKGEYEDGLSAFAKSRKFYRASHNVIREITSYSDTGWIYLLNLDQPQEALKWFEKAENLCIRYPHDEQIQEAAQFNLTGIGYVQVKLGDYSKAMSIFTALLPKARKYKQERLEADCLVIIGDIYRRTKRYAEALPYCQMAATLYRKIHFQRNEAISLYWAGLCYMHLGRNPEALRFFNRSLQLCRESQEVFEEADTLAALCDLYARQKQPTVAILYGKQAVNLIQIIRRRIVKLDQTTKNAFLKSNEETYHTLARLLIEEGRYNEADEVLSMLKQNEFDQFVRRSPRGPQMEQVRVVMTTQEKPVVAEQDRQLANISKLSDELWNLQSEDHPTPQQKARLAEVELQLKTAQANAEAFYASIPTRFHRDKADVQSDQKQLGDTQDLLVALGGHVAQVTTFLDEKGLDLLVTLPQGPTIHLAYPASDAKTGGKSFKEWLSTRTYQFVKAIEAGATTDNSVEVNNRAIELNNILSCHGALHSQLQGGASPITTVMWRLTDALRAVPLAALRDKDGYWVEKYQNVLLIERSSDFVLKDKPQDNWKVLGLGVTKAWTVKGEQFPALSGVKAELQAVVDAPADGFFGGALPGHVLEDSKFNQNSFLHSLHGTTAMAPVQWQVIHVASHFKVSDDASQSYLLMGDGQALTLSTLHELASMNRLFRGVDLVTLSACQTAQGTDSLGALVVENGAKSVLATLWPVADKETAQLMGDFYSIYVKNKDKGKASALQQAQLHLLHSGTASARPYFWAPFVLMGNWK